MRLGALRLPCLCRHIETHTQKEEERPGERNSEGAPNQADATMTETTKTHVILLACGSFNPITKGHIQMFGESPPWAQPDRIGSRPVFSDWGA